MLGLSIFAGLIAVGIAMLIVLKTKSNRAAKGVARGRAAQIERERIETVTKAEGRERN